MRVPGLVIGAFLSLALILPTVASAKQGDVIVGLDGGSSTVVKIKPNGAQSIFSDGDPLESPGGGDFAPDGTFYQSDYVYTGIFSLPTNGGTAVPLPVSMLYSSISDVEYHPDGKLYASDFGSDSVYRVNRKTGAAVEAASGGLLGGTYALSVAPSGKILVAENANQQIVRVGSKTGAQKLVSDDPDVGFTYGVISSADGKRIYSIDHGGQVVTIDPKGPPASNATPLNSDNLATGSYDLAFDLDGNLLTTGISSGNVARIDPKTGAEDVFATGDLLNSPEGITVEPPKCKGKMATIYGTPGKDKIKASPYKDVIVGLAGNDTIKGLGGKDVICGNEGRDKLVGGPKKDKLIGGPGKDKIKQ